MNAAIWGLIGTVVGALASIATTWLSAKSTTAQQEAKEQGERRERANSFQRETLLELQEAIHDTLRLTHRAYIQDSESLRNGTSWSKAMLSEELSESIRVAFRLVTILVERVSDDFVRTQVKALMNAVNQVMFAKSEGEALEQLVRCQKQTEEVLEKLGKVLRSHY